MDEELLLGWDHCILDSFTIVYTYYSMSTDLERRQQELERLEAAKRERMEMSRRREEERIGMQMGGGGMRGRGPPRPDDMPFYGGGGGGGGPPGPHRFGPSGPVDFGGPRFGGPGPVRMKDIAFICFLLMKDLF